MKKITLLIPALAATLGLGLGWAEPAPVTVTIIQRTPIETLATDGHVSAVTEATIGAHYTLDTIQGSQAVLQDAQGTRYIIALTSTDYAAPQTSSSQANDATKTPPSNSTEKENSGKDGQA